MRVVCGYKSLDFSIGLYLDAPLIDKEKIEMVVIKYLIIFNKFINDIVDKLPKNILKVLTKKRKAIVMKESNIRPQARDW